MLGRLVEQRSTSQNRNFEIRDVKNKFKNIRKFNKHKKNNNNNKENLRRHTQKNKNIQMERQR